MLQLFFNQQIELHPRGILFRVGLAKHLDNPLPDQLQNFVSKPRPSSEVGAVVSSPASAFTAYSGQSLYKVFKLSH
ncbi:hypothetical protein KC19_6G113800 [Ceratodon purpureus]|uniref:Uncharacterized protein n=1 Tax=Ceratodon purpureus TaxID=3225 RepID=A0A8T0HDY1_CERPU|nr:hypothetical protein KC19_6G113800 [Ceratodon purpureus]